MAISVNISAGFRAKTILFFSNFFFRIKGLVVFFAFLVLNFSLKAQVEWVKQMGGADGDIAACSSVDAAGHLYTIGTFSGTSSFGPFNVSAVGKGDVFITRANASTGNVDWVRQIGGSNEDNGNSIICDPFGDIYCTGKFSGTIAFGSFTLTGTGNSDCFLVKLDPSTGIIVWAKKLGGTGADGGLSVTCDAQGNIFTSGYFQGLATFGTFTLNPVGTNFNIFLTKTDGTTGNALWAHAYGSSGYSFGTSVSCDATGDVYLTGNYESEINFGTYTLTAVLYQDIFVSKHYSTTGNVAWAVSSGGSGNDNGNALAAGTDGYIYTTGKFESDCAFGTTTLSSAGSADIFLSKRNAITGNLVWVKQFGAIGYEQANAISQDADGQLFIAGHFNGFVNFGPTLLSSFGNADILIAKIDPATGNATWATSMGGINVDSAHGICIGQNNAIYCSGFFQSNAKLENIPFSSKGLTDIFIIKFNSATVGIEEERLFFNPISIMPVPFNEELNIVIHESTLATYKLILTDISGKIILQTESEQSTQKLSLAFLKPGIYFIELKFRNTTQVVRKVIKN